MDFYGHCGNLNGEEEWLLMRCKPVSIAGFEALDLVVHRPVGERSGWIVSERSTWRYVTGVWKTQQGAIDGATTELSKRGLSAIQESIMNNGLSPAYLVRSHVRS